MKYSEINETPIGDFELINDFNKEGSFDIEDRKSLQNFKYITKIKNSFENIPYDFNFYFLNLPVKFANDIEFTAEFRKYLGKFPGVYSTNKNIIMKLEDYFPNFNTDLNNINMNGYPCLFLSNANPKNSNKIPLTPWILIHRYFHGVDDSTSIDSWTTYKKYITDNSLGNLLTMKSSRMGVNNDPDVELATQYVMKGSVKFKNNDNIIHPYNEPFELREKENKINEALKLVMNDLKNKLVVTI